MALMAPADPPPVAAKPPKRGRGAWDIVFPIGLLALLLTLPAAILLDPYCQARYNSINGFWLLSVWAIGLPALLVVSIARLVKFWRRLGLRGRILMLVPLVLAVLLFVPGSPTSFRGIRAVLPDNMAAYLYGFRNRVIATADWAAIRQWAKETRATRPKDLPPPLEWPPCVKSLGPWHVIFAKDGVVLECPVTFAFINPPTWAALIVFNDEGAEMKSRPDAYRIAPGVWVAYYQDFDCGEDPEPEPSRIYEPDI